MERQHLVAHLEMTGSWLVDEVSGLSPAQLRFRPAPGSWSILEYARTTNDDLRAHVVEREQSDAYQWLLLISTHAQRHIPRRAFTTAS
jgi:hypothetical protein